VCADKNLDTGLGNFDFAKHKPDADPESKNSDEKRRVTIPAKKNKYPTAFGLVICSFMSNSIELILF
jgi:hypothetical protein